MIDLDLNTFWDSLTPKHKSGGVLTIKELGASNNHNELMYEYQSTDYFLSMVDEVPNVVSRDDYMATYSEIANWLLDYERSNPIPTIEVVTTISKKWAEYLLAPGSGEVFERYRFSVNHLKDKEKAFHTLDYAIDFYNRVKVGDYPDRLDYHKLCSALWTLCDSGSVDIVIQIGEFFKELAFDMNSDFIRLYTSDDNRCIDSPYRFIMSISWPVAQGYKFNNDYDNARRTYRDIMNIMLSEKLQLGIHYYCGNNRGLEAGLELYKLEPTNEVRDWCFSQWKRLTELDIENDTESVSERLMIAYMFLRVIYNTDIE